METNFKFDKETLIKHRFWIGLGVFAPLWIVAWLVLWLSVSDSVQEVKADYAKSVKAIDGVKDPKNANYVNPMTQKKEKLADRKYAVWEVVWGKQGNLTVDWPSDSKTPQLAALASAPFLTPVKDEEVVVRQLYRDNLYGPWIERKRQEFNLLAGPMSFDFYGVIHPAPISDKANSEYAVTMDEIWLNAETVWVKRELLWILRQTIEDIALFHPIKAEKEEALPAGIVARQRFRNTNWELDLLLKRGDNRQLFISKNSTIKNVNEGKRTLPLREVKIGLAQGSADEPDKPSHWREFLIEGDPVPWNKAVAIGPEDVKIDTFGFVENLPMLATQVFTWTTSPIKQIDAIELGWNSSRTAFQPPKAAKWAATGLEKLEVEAASSTSGTTVGTGAAPGGSMAGGMAGGAAAPPTGAAAGKSTSPYAAYVNANRYIQITPQVRRIAVGIVVAIDQAYVEDLVSQFVNCRLRFQPTQVQWQQDTRPLKQPEPGTNGPAGPEMLGAGRGGMPMPGPGGAGNPMMGMMQGMQDRMAGAMRGGTGGANPMMGMMMGVQGQMQGGRMRGPRLPAGPGLPGNEPIGPAGANTPAPATGEESDPNFVQFALYGVISLYDQYVPPAQASGAAAAAAPNAAAAPGAAAPGQPDAAPKAGDQPKTDGTPKVDAPKTDGTPKAADPPKSETTPKAEDKTTAPKTDDKKTEEKSKEGEAKKNGENKGG